MIKSYLNLFVLTLLIASCDPCDDCDSILFEPTINLVFINQDSLDKIDVRRKEINSFITELDEELRIIDSILTHLNTRITDLNRRIEDGEDLEFEKMQAEDSVIRITSNRTTPQENKDAQEIILDTLNTTTATINSGLLFVDAIEIIETGGLLTFEDSATSFRVPLSTNASFFNYAVTIGDEINTFAVDYELFQEVDADRNVLIRARNIAAMITNEGNSFDSLVSCQENCLDGQATYTFYF